MEERQTYRLPQHSETSFEHARKAHHPTPRPGRRMWSSSREEELDGVQAPVEGTGADPGGQEEEQAGFPKVEEEVLNALEVQVPCLMRQDEEALLEQPPRHQELLLQDAVPLKE